MADGSAVADHTIDYCKSILDFNSRRIDGVDQKAAFLTGISSVVLTLIAGLFFQFRTSIAWWNLLIGVVAMAALFVCFWYAVSVVIPATANQVTYKEPANDFFCRWICERTREQFRDQVSGHDRQTVIHNYLNEVYTLAEILSRKYHRVRTASYALLVAIILLFAQIVAFAVKAFIDVLVGIGHA